MNVLSYMNDSRCVIVIGDKFSALDNVTSCISFSEWNKIKGNAQENVYFIPGQGLNEGEHTEITDGLPKKLKKIFNISYATKEQTHKKLKENILLGNFEYLSDSNFRANLIIDDENELLQDHITGIHISGMIFIEATRQICIAIVDFFSADKNDYLVINDIMSNFFSYAYFLPIEIIVSIKRNNNSRFEKYDVQLDFIQSGIIVAKTSGSFITMDKKRFKSTEERGALISVKKFINRVILDQIHEIN